MQFYQVLQSRARHNVTTLCMFHNKMSRFLVVIDIGMAD